MGDNHQLLRKEVEIMVKVCPECKTTNPDNADFCQGCGQELTTVTNQSKSSGGLGAWWNKQSRGGKAAIGLCGICCIGLIVILLVSGMSSPDKTTSTTTTTPTTTTTSNNSNTQSATGIQVQVIYAGAWSGAIAQDSSTQSVDGSGNKNFDISGNPRVVSVNFQKRDGGSGTLTVNILQNGKVVKTVSTSAQYGVAGVAATF